MQLTQRVEQIQQRLAAASQPVTLIAVTKYASLDQMVAAYHAGIRHFGENKVQDALEKMEQLPPEVVNGVQWHLIGHLQSNKINKTLGRFALIHSVDSVDLAEGLSLRNVNANLIQPILLQVNVSKEATKHGFAPEETLAAMQKIMTLKGVRVQGLMTMAPATTDEQAIADTFAGLANLRELLISSTQHPLPELSMGMTQDYIHAIPCGATMVRIGSAIFR